MTTPAKRKVESQPKLKLYYFNIRGKGEPIRLFCAYAGLELEDFRFASREDFGALKEAGKLSFGQVPLLEIDEGKHQLVQTNAIMRYLSVLAGLYPLDDPIAAAKIDAALDQQTDAFTGITAVTYSTRFGLPLQGDAIREAAYQMINQDVLPRHLGNLEKMLQASSTGWIANTGEPSMADFVWWCALHHSLRSNTYLDASIQELKEYPSLQAFCQKFSNLDAIREYYEKEKAAASS